MRLECLKSEIKSGDNRYPIYIAFADARMLQAIAVAPAFNEDTLNSEIATNVLTPPVASWQRPLIPASISAIKSTFDASGRIMPNSVLLAKNPQSSAKIIPRQQTVGGVTPTNIWEIELPVPGADEPPPLWILDGQHRIKGLAESNQADNPLPLVLLLNDDAGSYDEARLAEIFAQVTTTAASLDDLHNDWMSFAFKLGEYSDARKDSSSKRLAMEATALMCKMPNLGPSGQPNPFRDQIKFNPKRSPDNFLQGFSYNCSDMQKVLYNSYFQHVPESGIDRLSAEDLARQMGLALIALKRMVKAPQDKTVFFGDTRESAQRIMQDAFISGVSTRLLQQKPPIDWAGLLEALKFDSASWDFRSSVVSLRGEAQTTSRKIANAVFRRAFSDGSLPGQADLGEILMGDGATFRVSLEPLSANGRAATEGAEVRDLGPSSKLSTRCVAGQKRRLKVISQSANIGKIQAIDADRSTAHERVRLGQVTTKKGLILDPEDGEYSSPLVGSFLMHLYGGQQQQATLSVTWIDDAK